MVKNALVLTGIEFVFFTVPGMVLVSVFLSKIMFITMDNLVPAEEVLIQHQGLLCFSPHQPEGSWGGTQLGQPSPSDQRDSPNLTVSCLAVNLRNVLSDGICLGESLLHMIEP